MLQQQEKPSAGRASGSWLIVFQLYALSHLHAHWQVIRVSDRMQAKPFSVFIHLPYIPFPPSPYAIILRCSEQWQEAPGARKPVVQWQLTFDSLSQRHHHATLVCFHSSSHCQCAFSAHFFFFSFNFVSLLPTSLSVSQAADSNNLLSSWLFQLALCSAPLPKPETFTRQLNVCNHPRGCSGGRPQGFCVMGWCVKSARGSLADCRSCPTTGPEAPVSFQTKILKHVKIRCVEVLYRVVNGCGK